LAARPVFCRPTKFEWMRGLHLILRRMIIETKTLIETETLRVFKTLRVWV
jgi:hypothetical protein